MNKYYIFSLIILLTACYDDFDNSRVEIIEEKPTTIITTGINGKILNIGNYNPSQLSLQIDDNNFGIKDETFFIELDRIAKTGKFLRLKLNDKTIGLKQTILVENDINYSEITTFQSSLVHSLESDTQSEIVLNSDLKLEYGGKAFDKDGILFNGPIDLYVGKIDDPIGLQNLAHLAFDINGEPLLLTDISSAYWIESMDENENPVFMNPETNSISFTNLSSGLRLFQLIEDSSLEEIEDLSQVVPFGGAGLFILAEAEPAVILEGDLEFKGEQVSYSKLNYDNKYFHSTALGRWISVFEKENDVNVILGGDCDQSSNSWTFFTGSTNSQANKLTIDDNAEGMLLLDAKIVDCSGSNEDVSALLIDQLNKERLFIYPSGVVDGYTSVCSGDLNMKTYNLDDNVIVNDINWSSTINSNIRYLTSCTSLAENFSLIEINGERMVYNSFDWYVDNGETRLVERQGRFEIKFDGSSIGSHPNEEVNLFIKDEEFGEKGYSISCINSSLGCGINNLKLSHFETTNGWVRIEFEGKIWAQTINPPIAGNYAIEGVIMIKTN